VTDADGSTDTATIHVQVGSGTGTPAPSPTPSPTPTPTPSAPPSSGSGAGTGNPVFAYDDNYKIDADKSLWFNTKYLTWNDKGADGGLHVTKVETHSDAGATITWASDGTVRYIPVKGWHGTDSFDYTVTDANGSTDTATIHVQVGGGTSAPAPSHDAGTVYGTHTASFASTGSAVTADLNTHQATYTTHDGHAVRIMPMGDSHTYGVMGYTNKESGGYRIKLADKLADAGIKFDFVGSQHNGPSTFDNDHEGYGGWQADQLAARAPAALATYKPDVVLLMAGSNDARYDHVATMESDMVKLVDTIAHNAPNAMILVATTPPSRPDNVVSMSQAKLDAFNAWLPGMVADKAAHGMHIKLVSNANISVNDINTTDVDWGVHLTSTGYEKLATNWFNALKGIDLDQGGATVHQQSLPGTNNLTGSAYNDTLKGDNTPNILSGGAGNDTIQGGGGNDRIDGGAGNDKLTGGAGADSFIFLKGKGGADTILDFNRTEGDHLQTDYKLADVTGWGSHTLSLHAAGGPTETVQSNHVWSQSDLVLV
jgi:lysophospholipase L1-like esterase